MSLSSFKKAAMLTIGDELLRGDITDANTPYLARFLKKHGALLERVVVVPDDPAQIIEELQRLKSRYQLIFTSGGMGPTHDDVTVEAVAAALGREVVYSPEIRQKMEDYYGAPVKPAKLLMTRMPAGSQLLFGAHRWWPIIICDGLYILPGVPEIFAACIDFLEGKFATRELAGGAIYLRVGETIIADQLRQIQTQFPEVVIGSYPSMDGQVKLNVVHEEQALVDQVIECLRTTFKDYLIAG